MSTYLYGIVPSDHPATLTDQQPVEPSSGSFRRIDGPGITAIVSDVDELPPARRRNVNAHHRVLQALCDEGTVLPIQFGTVAPDDTEVNDDLERGEADYLAVLSALHGKAEVNVKASYQEEGVLRQVLQDSPQLRKTSE